MKLWFMITIKRNNFKSPIHIRLDPLIQHETNPNTCQIEIRTLSIRR